MLYFRLSSVVVVFVAVVILVCCSTLIKARPSNEDTQIHRIEVPYQRYVNSNAPRYQFPEQPLKEFRRVRVPDTTNVELKSTFLLNGQAQKNYKTSQSAYEGMPVNFVEEAYPVYYMSGNVNGHFNGKIFVLVE